MSKTIIQRLEQFTHLQKDGRGYRAKKCPLCGNENYALGVDLNPIRAHCFACDGRTKDVLEVLGLDSRDLAPSSDWTPPARVEPTPDEAQRVKLERLWGEAFELDSRNVGGQYLASRGLTLERFPQNVRVHGLLDYWAGGAVAGVYPALLSRVENVRGELMALHKTYLSPDGRGKAPVNPAKKFSRSVLEGGVMGAAVRLSVAGERLAVGEGIETSLAVKQVIGLPTWAAVSAGGLERLEWPSSVSELLICADHDVNGRGLQAAHVLARRALEAGLTVKLALPPEPGTDWLDVLVSERQAVSL